MDPAEDRGGRGAAGRLRPRAATGPLPDAAQRRRIVEAVAAA